MACRLLKLIIIILYYSIGDQHYWSIAIILAICDTFTVMVASQAKLLGYPHMRMHACVLSKSNLVTLAKARPAEMIFILVILGASKKVEEDQRAAGSGVSAASGVQVQPKPVQLLTKKKKEEKQQIY